MKSKGKEMNSMRGNAMAMYGFAMQWHFKLLLLMSNGIEMTEVNEDEVDKRKK